MDSGNTAWVLIAAALVLFMTPGLAFFYGGMVRSKNVLGMLMQNIFAMGIVSTLWAVIGFSIAFGGDNAIVGNLDFAFMKDVTTLDGDIPGFAFFAFQMMFAVITPALITGATADRLKFGSYALFIAIWSIVVYAVAARWVFNGNGWIFEMGALDFAGGAAIHINAGLAALAVIMVIGNRKGHGTEPMPPHNLPLTVLGTGILWFGWFGFNAGSALAADGVAAQALVNTQLGAATGMLGWLLVERIKTGHATTLGACSGAVAGLVAITPCAGFVGGVAPLIIGSIAGAACYFALFIKAKMNWDDSLDVIAVHLVGGIIGTLLLGFFADTAVNGEFDGLFFGGGAELLKDQFVAAVGVGVFSFVVTYIIALAIQNTIGLRVEEESELVGLDQSEHAESAYTS
ncbi:ammonium transporter [Ilumatobacter coccineus]|uniref:Ammonium transporter n=1 Tax=Ilumatobacter coccineus (strain NBRC 103263 / KCTC 29153 / YM16-304) TaxID=1313172 RepID=A0A6C7E3X8_ILUCY|nr:ammonium transporter [Ilumatobacter coccineus]BAN01323.1 ammonium transporter [Ilumatobacter coccineus YM16-304]